MDQDEQVEEACEADAGDTGGVVLKLQPYTGPHHPSGRQASRALPELHDHPEPAGGTQETAP